MEMQKKKAYFLFPEQSLQRTTRRQRQKACMVKVGKLEQSYPGGNACVPARLRINIVF